MTTVTNHHPSQGLLISFNEGSLSTGLSVAVSAHLEYCGSCRRESDSIKAELAQQWLSADPSSNTGAGSAKNVTGSNETGSSASRQEYRFKSASFEALLENITSRPQMLEESRQSKSKASPVELHMHERSVKLPRVLARVAEKGVIWRKLAGGIDTATLTLDRDAQCDFMYMKPGSQAPKHTHRGIEVTLVLDGTFEDELGEYRPGDFVLRQSDQTHTPRSDDGCLCYSVLDSPLLFTSGWSRLLNPFQRYLFNRQLRQSA